MAKLIEMEKRLKKDVRRNKNSFSPIRIPQKKQAAYQVWKEDLKSCIKRKKMISRLGE